MTSPLDSLVTLTFVADASTPAQFLPTAGRALALAASVQVGTGGHLEGIPGVVRQGAAGLEFLMMDAVPGPATDAGPVWAQQLRADLTVALTAAHDERVQIGNALTAALGKLDQIIQGAARADALTAVSARVDLVVTNAARQATLTTVAADVTAIKTKVGA